MTPGLWVVAAILALVALEVVVMIVATVVRWVEQKRRPRHLQHPIYRGEPPPDDDAA